MGLERGEGGFCHRVKTQGRTVCSKHFHSFLIKLCYYYSHFTSKETKAKSGLNWAPKHKKQLGNLK